MIIHQHAPEHQALAGTLEHLLAERLGRKDAEPSGLLEAMREGMMQLAERDADAQLATLLQTLVV